MADNLAQLDQGGSNCQWVKTWLGPTLGWAMLPVVPELIINTTAALILNNYASRVILKAAVTSVTLPSVKQWMLATLPLANQAAYDRSIWVKDFSGTATASPITFSPNGSDLIDGLASWTMATAYDLVQFYPLSDLSGWYVNS
jgi:hypothetical protein